MRLLHCPLVLVVAVVFLGACGSQPSGTTATTGASTIPAATGSSGSASRGGAPQVSAPHANQATARLGRTTKTSGCQVRGVLPDPACTPGGVLASADLGRICVAGYTKTVRNVLPSTKDAVFAAYGIPPREGRRYEIDHLVPLELGGNNARANLWPQIAPGYGQKDAVENELHAAACARRVDLTTAQVRIARDWQHTGVAVPAPGSRPSPPRSPRSSPAPAVGGAGFCATHTCIPSFDNGTGTIVQCADGQWSHSGGRPGVCNRHGGPK